MSLTCEVCGKEFKNLAGKQGHMATVHGETTPEGGTKQEEKANLELSFWQCLDTLDGDMLRCCLQLKVSPSVGHRWATNWRREKLGDLQLKQFDSRLKGVEKELELMNEWLLNLTVKTCPNCMEYLALVYKCGSCDYEDLIAHIPKEELAYYSREKGKKGS